MNLNLAPKDEAFLKGKVEAGYYVNMAEAIRDAIRRMREAEETRQSPIYDAVMKAEEYLARGGKLTLYTSDLMNTLKQNAVLRAANNEKPSSDVIPQ